jgi:trehalose 6-phosphate synthase
MMTPLRDRMNLLAKEFVAPQNYCDPVVLVLSQFAGAAMELDKALIVNPHETDPVADPLKRALEMRLDERRERHAPILFHVLNNDSKGWLRSYMLALADRRTERGFLIRTASATSPLPRRATYRATSRPSNARYGWNS